MKKINKLKIFYSSILVVFAFFVFSSKAFAVTYSATGTNHTGTYQTYSVPTTGTYTIEAWGAEGGNYAGSGFANGGKGAYIKGDFTLTAGTTLQILVGQKPADSSGASGGGGGSFVAQGASYSTATLLLAAGGGGGRGSSIGGSNLPDGNITTTGSNGNYAGGTGPNGAADAGNSGWGGPGAGFSGNGPTQANYGGTAYSFTNGGTGGAVFTCSGYYGGFGGGGGGGCNGGGGGGGYGGGGAGGPGGGGGSYNGGTNQTNTAGVRTGSGQVIITPGGSGPTVTTDGSYGADYQSFMATGSFVLQNYSNVYVRYGTSNVGCSSLGSTINVANWNAGTYNSYSFSVYSLSPSTTYYFCFSVYDSVTTTTTYSSTTRSQATTALPPPAFAYTQSSAIDDTSAIVGSGMVSYVSSPTVTARWGTSNVACSSLPNTAAVTAPTGSDLNNYISYSKRITGLSPSTTYYWCIQGTTTQGTGYSNVSSFATSAALGTGCDLLPGSGLASAGDKTTIAGYLGTSKMQGTLLYKATTNGWASGTFHTVANTQGETITLVKNSGNNKVFGAYNPQSWSSGGTYTTGANAFLFNLSDGYQLKQFMSVYQAYNAAAYGPTFGGGHDVGFPNTTLNVGTYTNIHSYEAPSSKGAPSTYINGTNTNTYTPSDIEVYKIAVCTASAPSVTTPTSANITGSSVTLGANVTSAGTQPITARGVCYSVTSTNANPQNGGAGVTCAPEGGTTTGVFTVNVSNLTPNTGYSYTGYSTNSVGTGYTSASTFSTLNVAPTTVGTGTNGTPQSYYVQLNGQANPNGYPTFGHFRVFTANPGNCNTDTGGTRFPAGTVNFPDIDLGSGTGLITNLTTPAFTYTIPFNSGSFLYPNTTYFYCAYAVNTVNSTNYTTGASGVVSFITPDGPASPCDPPSSGNLTIPSGAACNFNGTFNGVDSGTGSRNTGVLNISGGVQLSIAAGQTLGLGSMTLAKGSVLTLARGSLIKFGPIYVHDKDRDNYLDDTTQYVGSTASASTEFIRRNLISSVFNYSWKIASSGATYDCNNNSAYAYRILPNLVRDADNDGYKTSAAAAPSCVGAAGVFNGRTYYNDGSGPN